MNIEGDMFLTINDKDSGFIKVLVNNDKRKELTSKTHPNIDKQLFNDKGILGLKVLGKGFPVGNPLKVLHWSLKYTDESSLPLSITCWPSSKGNKSWSCIVEYELQQKDLQLCNVEIAIPIPSEVKIDSIENGTYTTKQNILTWILDNIDSKNSNGILEFSVNSGDEGSFFPITVKFSSPNTISGTSVLDVLSTKDDSPVRASKDTSLSGLITMGKH